MSNVIEAVFCEAKNIKTDPVWRIDRGMQLHITGLDLPDYYQVHFANQPVQGEAIPVLASGDTVDIPDQYFQTGEDIYAWIYLTPAEGVAYTTRMITIPVKARPDISDAEPTPAQESIIDSAIAALNENVGIAETSAQTAQEAATRAETAASSALESETNAQSYASSAHTNANSAYQSNARAAEWATQSKNARTEARGYANDAAASATSAEESAATASQAASQAAASAASASQSASAASGSASSASTSASGASASASAAQTARSAAESAADRAETAVSQLVDIRATAQTLAPGSAATASYNNGVITLGIPQGAKGDKGDTGDTGPAGSPGPAGVGVPTGGTAGQVLAKKSGTNYDTEWVDQSGGGGGTSDYTDLTHKPSINGVTLTGNKSLSDLGAASESDVAAKYTKPSTGIPASDLASAVQTSLGKADTALQSAPVTSVNSKTGAVTLTASDVGAGTYSKPSGGIPKSDLASAVQTSLGKADTALQSAPVTSVNGQTGAVVLSIPSTAADVGAIAAPASPATGAFLVWSGSAWTAQTLSTWQGGSY